jgi:hypothetical protein
MEDPPIERGTLEGWLELFQVPNFEEVALYDHFFKQAPE